MKKQLLFLSLIFLFLISNVCSQTVYVTKTGKKYHNEGCRYLSRSSIAISLPNAIKNGYTPCSICKPSTTAAETYATISQPSNKNYRQAISVQCSAITKAGRQCKRMTRSPNGRCWQHGGN